MIKFIHIMKDFNLIFFLKMQALKQGLQRLKNRLPLKAKRKPWSLQKRLIK